MTVQEISLVVQMRRILSDRNMFSTLYSLANIKVFKRNSQLSTMFDHFPFLWLVLINNTKSYQVLLDQTIDDIRELGLDHRFTENLQGWVDGS